MRNVRYRAEDGRVHLAVSIKKPLIALPGDLQAVVLWLIRAAILVGAAWNVRHASWLT